MDNNKMRLIDANKITPDSNIVNTITNLISKCGGKYNSGCVATNCTTIAHISFSFSSFVFINLAPHFEQ